MGNNGRRRGIAAFLTACVAAIALTISGCSAAPLPAPAPVTVTVTKTVAPTPTKQVASPEGPAVIKVIDDPLLYVCNPNSGEYTISPGGSYMMPWSDGKAALTSKVDPATHVVTITLPEGGWGVGSTSIIVNGRYVLGPMGPTETTKAFDPRNYGGVILGIAFCGGGM